MDRPRVYILDKGVRIGPMDLDQLVLRTWEGSLTLDTPICDASSMTHWQAAREVVVIGPLLGAVAAGRPSGCHWQRFDRRRADGTLWRHIQSYAAFFAGGAAYCLGCGLLSGSLLINPRMLSGWLGWEYTTEPRFSLLWWPAVAVSGVLAYMLAHLAQIAWYFISDVARDRKARIAARSSPSGAHHDEQDAAIFVYELPPEIRRHL
jgi:hypothetical protein